jgi:4,5:9,10-diseco-3-hydroxy-5,9,17-trioxoandrosta-1(10),2-diene-4-oate hydrolase
MTDSASASASVVPVGQHTAIELGGRQLSVHSHAAGPQDGPVVVFVHGSGPGASGYSNFKGNFRALSEHGFRTLVPDLLGYGHSDKPDEEDDRYTLRFLADGVKAYLDALGVQKCSLVGNSLGGAICVRLALDEPDRFDKLVLMAPGGLEDRDTYMAMSGIRSMLRCIFGPEGISREGLQKVFSKQLYDSSALSAGLIEERYEIAMTQPRRVFETSRVPDQSGLLEQLTQSVLAFWGVDDQFCPVSGAMKIATGCKDAQVTVLTKCGHWVMVEHRDLFNRRCAEFLKA